MTAPAGFKYKLAYGQFLENKKETDEFDRHKIDWISIVGDAESTIRLNVSINGVDVTSILDTGAAFTVVDRQTSSRLGIEAIGDAIATGNVNAVNGAWGSSVSIKIGKAVIHLSKVLLLDLSAIALPGGAPIGLILGNDIFEQFVLDVDLSSRRLALRSSQEFQPMPGAEEIKLRRGGAGERFIMVSIEGRTEIPATLDLGSSNPVMISADYANSQQILEGKQVSSAAVGGVDGINITRTSSLTSINLGANQLLDVPCEIFANWYSAEVSANIGLPVLSRFHFAIDFKNGRMWIIAQTASETPSFQRDLSGLGLATGPDRLIVMHVAVGSPAAVDGWMIGEFITAVDGCSITKDYSNSSLSKWRYGPVGKTVELTLNGSTKRKLLLRRYY